MPWTSEQSAEHTHKADTPAKKKKWAKIANAVREREMANNKSESEASAIAVKTANAAMEESLKESFQEFAYGSKEPHRVDRDKCIVYGVKVLGPSSKNTGSKANDYPASTQSKALSLIEGSAVLFDHNDEGDTRCRPYGNRNGCLINARQSGDSTYADHNYNPKHALTEQYLWDAEHAPQNVCFSINGDGVKKYNSTTKRYVVEDITSVKSVDLVSKGGTTNTLYESEDISDPELREFAEHAFSAISDCKSIIEDKSTDVKSKQQKLLGVLGTWRGEMFEGEVCDEVAKRKPSHDLNLVHNSASDLMSRCMYGGDECQTHEDKHKHMLGILSDWSREIKKLQSDGSTTNKESMNVEFKDITVASLRENRSDLVEQLTGTDAMSKLNKQVSDLTEALKVEKDKNIALETEKQTLALNAKIGEELKAAKVNTSDKTVCSDERLGLLREAKDEKARKSIIDLMVLAQKTAPASSAGSFGFISEGATPKSNGDFIAALRS